MKDVQRIAIVDPADATREPLRNMLLGVESVWLEAECSRYEFFLDVARQSKPDLVVIALDADQRIEVAQDRLCFVVAGGIQDAQGNGVRVGLQIRVADARREFTAGQTGETALAESVRELEVYDRCRCNSDYCSTVYTQPQRGSLLEERSGSNPHNHRCVVFWAAETICVISVSRRGKSFGSSRFRMST